MKIQDLEPGQVLSNSKLVDAFKCGNMGGMRKSAKTNSLVLISDPTKGLYDDRWDTDILHYTGMGKKGDQSLDFMQNKTLSQSKVNGISLHLFEVFKYSEYTYRGKVELINDPYPATQTGSDGKKRMVWIFPLKLLGPALITKNQFEEIEAIKEKKAETLSDAELQKRLLASRKSKSIRIVVIEQFERNPYVVETIKRKAKGACQLCGKQGPFNNKNGEPFLEVHHIVWLSKGGEDTIENAVALCPNCHRRMHILNQEEDRKYLSTKVKSN